MPSPQAKSLHVSPLQHELLQRMVQRTTSAQRLVKRGHIILEAAKGTSNTRIAEHQQVDYETVRSWRDWWHAAQVRLQAIEATGRACWFTCHDGKAGGAGGRRALLPD